MRIRRIAALSAALLSTGLVGVAPTLAGSASAATGEWQDGVTSSDTIINCVTQSPSVGVSANTGWRSTNGEVPEVGEKFYLRGYISLVGLPCSGKVATVPEILPPAGFSYPDEPVLWGVNTLGESGELTDAPLDIFNGVNGGIVLTRPGDEPFVLQRGQVLEFQFPVVATREFKGTATQAPTCLSRRDGTAPCPPSQSGDHLQIAFAVGGHGGDKQYVTPYVPIFAAKAGTAGDTTAPNTTLGGGPANGAIVPSTSAAFSLGSTEAGSRFACTLDGRARACASGTHTVTGLAPGTHVLRASATDAAGNTDPTAATRTWTVPVPARSLSRSAGWSLLSAPSAYGGKVLASSRRNASTSYPVRGARRLALVASGGTTHGTVRVYAGSRLLKTISLRTTRNVTKRVIPVTSFSSAWTGTVKVVVATTGRTVRIEGIAAPTR
ncbi:hypothetical protein CFH99_07210 [Nocardioides aromaticivorans]|uniref:Bacterial Ig-like domain-containing protein n=1 Tax=Nocardioides aromaticivorans TaxID=200618 RepID=A0ABX7PI72_9ACTN|nr:hypothetical protein [Nocardioides aromaticivorans]QSR25412.1 hypothetical protein CFH99_07210 [Nocardioides aromaticivorans]